jgi:hypothetical protein
MKKLILLAVISVLAINSSANENTRLCKVFTDKVETYKANMRNDELAKTTLISYKERMYQYCDASKAETKKVEVPAVAAVKTETTSEDARLCKVFSSKADAYEATMRNDELARATLVSYKERRNQFCDASAVKS